MKTSAILHNAAQAQTALQWLYRECKPWLVAGHQLVVSVRPATRSSEQNARLHAMLTDVSRQCEWAGSKWDVEDWKRLMTAAWLRARRESAVMVPSIDGHGFDVLYRRTSKLTKAECAELIDYIDAWGSEHGMQWTERREPEVMA